MSVRVQPITRDEHLAFVTARPSASHTQVPSWGEVKPDWQAESLGWFDDGGQLVGAGLVLLRPLPGPRVPGLPRYLAYLPEGPLLDWYEPGLDRLLEPMLAHLRRRGAFAVRMGPPVVVRRWSADAVKAAITDPAAKRLRDVKATSYEPRAGQVAEVCAAWAGGSPRPRARTASPPDSPGTSSRCRSPAGRWRTSTTA